MLDYCEQWINILFKLSLQMLKPKRYSTIATINHVSFSGKHSTNWVSPGVVLFLHCTKWVELWHPILNQPRVTFWPCGAEANNGIAEK